MLFRSEPPIPINELITQWRTLTRSCLKDPRKRKRSDFGTIIPCELPDNMPSGLYLLFFLKLISEDDLKVLLSMHTELRSQFDFNIVLQYLEKNRPFRLLPLDIDVDGRILNSLERMPEGHYTVVSAIGEGIQLIYKKGVEFSVVKVGPQIEESTLQQFVDNLLLPFITFPIKTILHPGLNCDSNFVNPDLYSATCSDELYSLYRRLTEEENNSDCKEDSENKRNKIEAYRARCKKNLGLFTDVEKAWLRVYKQQQTTK